MHRYADARLQNARSYQIINKWLCINFRLIIIHKSKWLTFIMHSDYDTANRIEYRSAACILNQESCIYVLMMLLTEGKNAITSRFSSRWNDKNTNTHHNELVSIEWLKWLRDGFLSPLFCHHFNHESQMGHLSRHNTSHS